jgi:hypothetical protein
MRSTYIYILLSLLTACSQHSGNGASVPSPDAITDSSVYLECELYRPPYYTNHHGEVRVVNRTERFVNAQVAYRSGNSQTYTIIPYSYEVVSNLTVRSCDHGIQLVRWQ